MKPEDNNGEEAPPVVLKLNKLFKKRRSIKLQELMD
jgi:hypothetical protein